LLVQWKQTSICWLKSEQNHCEKEGPEQGIFYVWCFENKGHYTLKSWDFVIVFLTLPNVWPRATSGLQQPAPACGLTKGWVTMLSHSQRCKLFYFALILLNGTGIQRSQCMQYATAHALEQRRNLGYSMLTWQQIGCLGKFEPWWF